MPSETPFETEARVIDEARQNLATGGLIPADAPFRITDDGCTFAVSSLVSCECGRDLHITVHLDPKQIESAANQILVNAQRRAATSKLG